MTNAQGRTRMHQSHRKSHLNTGRLEIHYKRKAYCTERNRCYKGTDGDCTVYWHAKSRTKKITFCDILSSISHIYSTKCHIIVYAINCTRTCACKHTHTHILVKENVYFSSLCSSHKGHGFPLLTKPTEGQTAALINLSAVPL